MITIKDSLKRKLPYQRRNWDYHTKRSKSERERQMPHDNIYMWNLKYDTTELIYKTYSQTERTDLQLPREVGSGRDGLGAWD